MSDVDRSEINKRLKKSFLEGYSVVAWDMNGPHAETSNFVINDYHDSSSQIVLKPQDVRSMNKIKRMLTGFGKINFYIENESLIFESELIALENDYLIIKKPLKAQLSDKREYERVKIEDRMSLLFKVLDKRVVAKVLDLTPGGMGVIVAGHDMPKIHDQDKVFRAILATDDTKVKLSFKIVTMEKVRPYQYENIAFVGKRLGLKIVDIDQATKEIITSLIKDDKITK